MSTINEDIEAYERFALIKKAILLDGICPDVLDWSRLRNRCERRPTT
jgi:hypothetical protein